MLGSAPFPRDCWLVNQTVCHTHRYSLQRCLEFPWNWPKQQGKLKDYQTQKQSFSEIKFLSSYNNVSLHMKAIETHCLYRYTNVIFTSIISCRRIRMEVCRLDSQKGIYRVSQNPCPIGHFDLYEQIGQELWAIST